MVLVLLCLGTYGDVCSASYLGSALSMLHPRNSLIPSVLLAMLWYEGKLVVTNETAL